MHYEQVTPPGAASSMRRALWAPWFLAIGQGTVRTSASSVLSATAGAAGVLAGVVADRMWCNGELKSEVRDYAHV